MQVAGVGIETLPSMPTNIDYTSADITDPHILADLCRGRRRDCLLAVSSYSGSCPGGAYPRHPLF